MGGKSALHSSTVNLISPHDIIRRCRCSSGPCRMTQFIRGTVSTRDVNCSSGYDAPLYCSNAGRLLCMPHTLHTTWSSSTQTRLSCQAGAIQQHRAIIPEIERSKRGCNSWVLPQTNAAATNHQPKHKILKNIYFSTSSKIPPLVCFTGALQPLVSAGC